MLSKMKAKGSEDWERYAWCVNDVMARVGNFERIPGDLYFKRYAYKDFMNGRLDKLELTEGEYVY